MGKESALKGVDTDKFEWRGIHSDFGSPLHAILFGKIRDDASTESEEGTANGDGFGDLIGDDIREKKARLALLRLAMEKGADPDAPAPPSCDVQKFWFLEKRGQRKETKSIVFAGKSVLQCLLAAERAIKMTDVADWKEDLEAIDEAMEILCTSNRQRTCEIVSEGVVDTWENALSDSEWADVLIRACGRDADDWEEPSGTGCWGSGKERGGDRSGDRNGDRWMANSRYALEGSNGAAGWGGSSGSSGGEVAVHGAVLRGASPVLRSMLSTTGMREGSRRVIEVQDCGIRSLRLFLSLVYTGTVSSSFCQGEEAGTGDVLAAVDLAHRWQVLHVVDMLATALQNRICIDHLEPIMDVAVRLHLASLLSSCRIFVADNAVQLQGYTSRIQSPAVRSEMEAVFKQVNRDGAHDLGMQPPTKRRRMSLQ